MSTPKKQWHVGVTRRIPHHTAFSCIGTPTPDGKYFATIGPFKTKRAALWAERYGYDNPHFTHVSDAERLAKLERGQL